MDELSRLGFRSVVRPAQPRTATWMAPLPRALWRTCTRCGGSGSREEAENCHRSAGIVPCSCGNGYVTYDEVTPEEYQRRRRAGQLADSRGVLIPGRWSAPTVLETTA